MNAPTKPSQFSAQSASVAARSEPEGHRQARAQHRRTQDNIAVDLTWLTWERLILAIALLTGVWLRFQRLDLQPLTTLEAGYAWSAWRIAEGLEAVWPGANPLFLSLQSALFWLTGGSDFWVRFWSALAGVGCIVVVASWRQWMGRGPALLLAVFVALAPWQVTLSRLGDGGAVALFLGLLAITLVQQRVNRADVASEQPAHAHESSAHVRRVPGPDIRLIGLALGLLVVAGPMAWMFVTLLLLWWVVARREFAAALHDWRAGLPVFLVAAVVGATGWLSRVNGLGDISGSLSIWLGRFGVSGESSELAILYHSVAGGDMSWLVWRIIAEQPLLTLLGGVGLATAWRSTRPSASSAGVEHRRGVLLMLLWFIVGLVWVILPARDLTALAFWGIPILAGAATLIFGVLSHIPSEMERQEAGSVGATLLILAAAGWIWMTGLSASLVLDLVLIQALLAICGLLILLMVLYAYWAGWESAHWVLMCLLLTMSLAGAVRATWFANFGNPGVAPNGHAISQTHRSIRQMVTDLETLSAQRTGDPQKMFVFLEPGLLRASASGGSGWREAVDPVLAWYLRGYRNITWPEQARLPELSEPVAYIRAMSLGVEAGDDRARAEGVYADTQYALRTLWMPGVPAIQTAEPMTPQDRVQVAWSGTLRPVLRWLVYREPPMPPDYQYVRLRLMLTQEQ